MEIRNIIDNSFDPVEKKIDNLNNTIISIEVNQTAKEISNKCKIN